MKAVIVEDEKLIASDLKKMLQNTFPDMEILATLYSLKEAVEWFSTHPQPDLAFMDIQLSDGTSFEIFNRLTLQFPVIFTTAYNEYAIKAFKVNSIDYLLKPVDEDDLKSAVEKYKRLYPENHPDADFTDRLQALINQMAPQTEQYKERFTVHYKNTLMPLETEEIGMFLRDELIYAHTFDGRKFIVEHFSSLDEIEKLLSPARFFRANRQCIVHMKAIDHYKSDYTGKIHVTAKLPATEPIDISREKAPAFRKWVE